jgi:autoinducer 2-degrading protein
MRGCSDKRGKREELAEEMLSLARAKVPTCPDLRMSKGWAPFMDERSRESVRGGVNMICMLIEVHVKLSALDEFLEVIKYDAVHSVQDELGCLRFDVLRDNDDPLKFYFYEVYKDKAAQLAHRETPHFAKWAEFMKYGLDREVVRHSTRNVHPTDAEWR